MFKFHRSLESKKLFEEEIANSKFMKRREFEEKVLQTQRQYKYQNELSKIKIKKEYEQRHLAR